MAQAAQPTMTNGFDGDKLRSFIDRVENINDDIASETGTFMKTVQDMKKDIKNILVDAKTEGVPVRALKAELKLRKLDRDKAKVVAGLEENDAESLEQIQEALGDFASSPLGEATLKAAQEARAN